MRWTYVIPRLVITLLLWSFLNWGIDPLLRYSSVRTLQAAIGAKAEISEFRTGLMPPRLNMCGVALANARKPGSNLIQFEELEFRLARDPLLRRQFVVEEGRLTGVRFQGIRSDDGLLAPAPPEDPDAPPSWLKEQLQTIGDEWLTRLTEQARAELDPNVLETYRTGNEIYSKWDTRFHEMSDRAKLLKPRVQELKTQFRNAKQGDTLQQIQQYLQVAQRAESLALEAQQMKTRLTAIVPDVRTDFARMDQARKNDLELVRRKIELLKPDGRRISETLIGDHMYLQLQQILSWIDLAREYQHELKEQTQPTRSRGTDFVFPIQNPTPDFHVQRLLVSGEIEIDGESVPFEAELKDVTNDAPLLQRPCVLRFRACGPKTVLVQLTYDATGVTTKTRLQASYTDDSERILTAGRAAQIQLTARLAEIAWDLDLGLIEDHLDGRIRLKSALDKMTFSTRDSMRPEFLQAARDALSTIHGVSADLTLTGTVRHPIMELHSDLGTQIADGVEMAFTNQIRSAQTRLVSEVNAYASDQVTKLTSRCASEYERLRSENAELLAQIQEVQQIVASLQSGRIDPNAVFHQVTESKVLSSGQHQKVGQAMEGLNRVLTVPGLPAPNGIRSADRPLHGLPSLLPRPLSGSRSEAPADTSSVGQLPVFEGFRLSSSPERSTLE